MRPTEKERYIADVLRRSGKKGFAKKYLDSCYKRYLAEQEIVPGYQEIPD